MNFEIRLAAQSAVLFSYRKHIDEASIDAQKLLSYQRMLERYSMSLHQNHWILHQLRHLQAYIGTSSIPYANAIRTAMMHYKQPPRFHRTHARQRLKLCLDLLRVQKLLYPPLYSFFSLPRIILLESMGAASVLAWWTAENRTQEAQEDMSLLHSTLPHLRIPKVGIEAVRTKKKSFGREKKVRT